MGKIPQIILGLVLAAAGCALFRVGYSNLDPTVNGTRPEGVASQRVDNQVSKPQKVNDDNPVRVMANDSAPYLQKMGIAAGGMIGGLFLVYLGWKSATRQKSSY